MSGPAGLEHTAWNALTLPRGVSVQSHPPNTVQQDICNLRCMQSIVKPSYAQVLGYIAYL